MAAYAEWVQGNQRVMISYFVPAILIFRAELLVLLGAMMLYDLFTKRISFYNMIVWGAYLYTVLAPKYTRRRERERERVGRGMYNTPHSYPTLVQAQAARA